MTAGCCSMVADTRSALNLLFPHDRSFTTKPFFTFSDIHDLRALQLAVHRLWIGLWPVSQTVSLQFPIPSSPSWPQRLVININWVMIGHVPLQLLISHSRMTRSLPRNRFSSSAMWALELAVHRMSIGLSDLLPTSSPIIQYSRHMTPIRPLQRLINYRGFR